MPAATLSFLCGVLCACGLGVTRRRAGAERYRLRSGRGSSCCCYTLACGALYLPAIPATPSPPRTTRARTRTITRVVRAFFFCHSAPSPPCLYHNEGYYLPSAGRWCLLGVGARIAGRFARRPAATRSAYAWAYYHTCLPRRAVPYLCHHIPAFLTCATASCCLPATTHHTLYLPSLLPSTLPPPTYRLDAARAARARLYAAFIHSPLRILVTTWRTANVYKRRLARVNGGRWDPCCCGTEGMDG